MHGYGEIVDEYMTGLLKRNGQGGRVEPYSMEVHGMDRLTVKHSNPKDYSMLNSTAK